MWLFVDRLHAPLLGAKLVADFLVFTCGCLWVMRLVVFRRSAPDLCSPV
jgi:ABC-type anion transport system duplicated permease subunit